jgi:ketosteroid isomerase-like protein
MSENVDLVRAAIHAFQLGDIDTVLRQCDPQIEITQPAELPGAPRHLRGHSGVLESFSIWTEQWDDFHVEVLDIAESDDHVIVTMINKGRGPESGIQVEAKFIHVFSIRAGKVTRWQMFTGEDEARSALADLE